MGLLCCSAARVSKNWRWWQESRECWVPIPEFWGFGWWKSDQIDWHWWHDNFQIDKQTEFTLHVTSGPQTVHTCVWWDWNNDEEEPENKVGIEQQDLQSERNLNVIFCNLWFSPGSEQEEHLWWCRILLCFSRKWGTIERGAELMQCMERCLLLITSGGETLLQHQGIFVACLCESWQFRATSLFGD